MQTGFWKKLKKPIMVLAPMANVTDAAFRPIIAKYGKPDVMFTEFVSCDGLVSPGQKKLLVDFMYTEAERPIVAQIFGSKPENFYKTALLIQELGFDGIDINMGCPDRNVEKQGAGACLMKNPKLAQEIIRETKRGAGKLPVSIKTRIGYNKNSLNEWLPALLETEPAAIILHARTRKEMSSVPANWATIADAVRIRDQYGSKTLILGNGDVKDLADAQEKIKATGVDGVMIGRGIFGNPWLFNRNVDYAKISIKEKLRVMVEHTYLFEKILGEYKNFAIMKKHYKAYANGFDGAKELRIKLMEGADTASDVERIVADFLNQLK
jgi:nifR3 family TIM-barrel protein